MIIYIRLQGTATIVQNVSKRADTIAQRVARCVQGQHRKPSDRRKYPPLTAVPPFVKNAFFFARAERRATPWARWGQCHRASRVRWSGTVQ